MLCFEVQCHSDSFAGEDNDKRLTGRHETGAIDQFTWGVANRGASVRIPRECAVKGYGYLEDRRPAVSNISPILSCSGLTKSLQSNADPYRITGILMETVFGAVPE